MLNPNLAAAWFLGGYLRLFRGEPEEAIDRFAHAIRLSPLDPEMFRMQTGMALAHLFARRFDIASSWASKAFREVPVLVLPGAVIASSHALAGRMEEAFGAIQHLLKFNPALRLASLEKWLPFRRQKISRPSRRACEQRGCRSHNSIVSQPTGKRERGRRQWSYGRFRNMSVMRATCLRRSLEMRRVVSRPTTPARDHIEQY